MVSSLCLLGRQQLLAVCWWCIKCLKSNGDGYSLPVLHYFWWIVQIGNIQGLLCYTAFFPIGALLAILIKPHYAIFAFLILAGVVYRRWKKMTSNRRLFPFSEPYRRKNASHYFFRYEERFYAAIIVAFIIIAFPTNQHAIDHALGSGNALTRPENWTFILPLYHVVATTMGWKEK